VTIGTWDDNRAAEPEQRGACLVVPPGLKVWRVLSQDAPQVPPPGRISSTVQGLTVGSKEVCALPARQLPQDPLRVQRVLVMLNGLGGHAVIVRSGTERMPS